MPKILFLASIGLIHVSFFFALSAFAAESVPEAKVIQFDEAARIALDQNYDLRTLRNQSESLKFKSGQALAPNPLGFSYTRNDVAGFSPGAEPYNEQYTLTYVLGFPGKSVATSAGLRHQSESAREDSYGKEIELMVLLGSNIVAQISNRETDKIMRAEVDKAKTLIQLQQTKYATGQAAQADIMGSRVNMSRLEETLLANSNEFHALQADFMNLLGHPDQIYAPDLNQKFPLPQTLPNQEVLNRAMLNNRPSLNSLRRQEQSSESALKNSYLQALPDFTFSVGMNQYSNAQIAPVVGLGRDYNFGISINLPLFFPINELEGIRASRADFSASSNRRHAAEMQAESELSNTYVNFDALLKEVRLMEETVIPAAKAYYSLGLSAYSSGKSDFLRLNDARSMYLSAQFDYIAKKKQLEQTFFQLVQVVGCDFTKTVGPHACD